VLDVPVGTFVHRQAREAGTAIGIPDFFGETTRW
jgi:ornithine cyclodeaminase